ncbi:MAG: peptidoglycan DD-metalloendopeptidase family protein [Elusimicrobiales bacterium]
MLRITKKRPVFHLSWLLAAALAASACGKSAPPAENFSLLRPTAQAPMVSTGTFKPGDTWNSALSAAAYSDIAAISKALKKAGVSCPRPGDLYAAAYSTSGAAAFALARGEAVYTVTGGCGKFSALKSPIPLSWEVKSASGTLESSLWEAMCGAGLPPGLIMEFADVFAWEIDFLTEPRKGDRFALVWEEGVNALGRRSGLRVKGGAYSGEVTGEGRGYLHEGYYYDGKGASLRRAFLRAPLSYRRISSFFSKARFHPVLRRYRAHNGIDYAAPPGTPVSAIADGVVSYKGWKGGYGNFIELRHANSCVTGYGHLRGFARGLKRGQKVAQGQVIGYVGSTGLSTGPHLDFSLKVNGKFTDFLKFRPPSVASLGGAELEKFKVESSALAASLESLLPAAR